jgi:hypothetical protein
VQDAVLASKRKDTPHLVAPIKRYATSKLAAQWLETLAAEQAAAAPLLPSAAAKPGSAAAAASEAAAAPASKPGGFFGLMPQALLGGQSSQSSQQQQQLAVIDSCEFLVPGDVMSALMTQVVADPAYADIMKALLGSRDGQEMYLRNPASFNLPTGGISTCMAWQAPCSWPGAAVTSSCACLPAGGSYRAVAFSLLYAAAQHSTYPAWVVALCT